MVISFSKFSEYSFHLLGPYAAERIDLVGQILPLRKRGVNSPLPDSKFICSWGIRSPVFRSKLDNFSGSGFRWDDDEFIIQ